MHFKKKLLEIFFYITFLKYLHTLIYKIRKSEEGAIFKSINYNMSASKYVIQVDVVE